MPAPVSGPLRPGGARSLAGVRLTRLAVIITRPCLLLLVVVLAVGAAIVATFSLGRHDGAEGGVRGWMGTSGPPGRPGLGGQSASPPSALRPSLGPGGDVDGAEFLARLHAQERAGIRGAVRLTEATGTAAKAAGGSKPALEPAPASSRPGAGGSAQNKLQQPQHPASRPRKPVSDVPVVYGSRTKDAVKWNPTRASPLAIVAPLSPWTGMPAPDDTASWETQWRRHERAAATLLPGGADVVARTELVASASSLSFPAPLRPAAEQNEWGTRHLREWARPRVAEDGEDGDGDGTTTDATPPQPLPPSPLLLHPDVGLPCGPSDTDKSALICEYYPAPPNGRGVQCCCAPKQGGAGPDRLPVHPADPDGPAQARFRAARGYSDGMDPSVGGPEGPLRLLRPYGASLRPFTCLPSVVVAGAQKSGTTALFGYLLAHPFFLPASKKELHFFDVLASYRDKGLDWYARQFPALTPPPESLRPGTKGLEGLPRAGGGGGGGDAKAPSSSSSSPPNPLPPAERTWLRYISARVTGEASPSYVLGRDTAARIASTLPHARVVVILRNPVDRAYSEYQMKLRRVVEQAHPDRPEEMRETVESVHACMGRAFAPLAALVRRATRIAAGEEFQAAVRDVMVARASSEALHGPSLGEGGQVGRGAGLEAAIGGEEGEYGPAAAEAVRDGEGGTADAALRSAARGRKLLDPLTLWRIPEDVQGGDGGVGDATDPLTQAVWDSVFVSVDELVIGQYGMDVPDAVRTADTIRAGARRGLARTWNAFVDRLRTIASDPLLSGAVGTTVGADELGEGEGVGEAGAAGAALSAAERDAVRMRVRAARDAVRFLITSLWGAGGEAAASECLDTGVLSQKALAPIRRTGQPALAAAKKCLLSALQAGGSDGAAGGEAATQAQGPSLSAMRGLRSFASSLFGSAAVAEEATEQLRRGEESGGGGKVEAGKGSDALLHLLGDVDIIEAGRSIEGFVRAVTAGVRRGAGGDPGGDAKGAAAARPSSWGWLGVVSPALLEAALRLPVQALFPSLVAEGAELKSPPAEANAAAPAGDPPASSTPPAPYPTPYERSLLACFTDKAGAAANAPRFESVGPLRDVFEAEARLVRACSLPPASVPVGRVREALLSHDPVRRADRDGDVSGEEAFLPPRLTPSALAALPNGTRTILADCGGATRAAGGAGAGGGGLFSSLFSAGTAAGGAARGAGSCWPDGSTSNIAQDFLYRGVYLQQLYRLHRELGRERVHVLVDTDLRRDPQGALDGLCDFLRLPRVRVGGRGEEGEREVEIEALLEASFPSFEKATGWRMSGRYEPMDEGTRGMLEELYAPHNRALYEYLGRDLGW